MSFKIYSWTVFDDGLLVKQTDKSTFEHRGLTLPRALHPHFNVNDMEHGDKRHITLIMNTEHISAYFVKESGKLGRIRLFWNAELSEYLRRNFPDYHSYAKEDFPYLAFNPVTNIVYDIFIASKLEYFEDLNRDDVFESYADGKETKSYVTKYERNPKNRENAIKAHGRSCMI